MKNSLYPGFHTVHTLGSIFLDTIYGLVDGAVTGLLFGWLYNLLSGHFWRI